MPNCASTANDQERHPTAVKRAEECAPTSATEPSGAVAVLPDVRGDGGQVNASQPSLLQVMRALGPDTTDTAFDFEPPRLEGQPKPAEL